MPLDEGLANGLFVEMNSSEIPKKMEDFGKLFHDTARTGEADYCAASAGYFKALGIPLIRGRMFDERDTENAPHVALISQSLAQKKWPGQDPIGHTVEFGNMDGDLRLLTIVGIVGDTREDSLEKPANPTIYVNILQRPKGYFTRGHARGYRSLSGFFGRAWNHAKSCAGCAASVPHIVTNLFGFDWFSKIQPDIGGCFCRDRIVAGHRRDLRRNGLLGDTAYA